VEKLGDLFFVDQALCSVHDKLLELLFVSDDLEAVHLEKNRRDQRSDSFITVIEGVVFYQMK